MDKVRCIELIDEAVGAGARQQKACELLGIAERTLQRWNQRTDKRDKRNGPTTKPKQSITEKEKSLIIIMMNSKRFRNLSPAQMVPILLDEGIYFASESTLYRILRSEKMLSHRQNARPATHSKPRELCAWSPNTVWTWDITWLRSLVNGIYYYLYMVIDVFSRMIVAWEIQERESMELSSTMMARACERHQVKPRSLALHADNGASMKGSTMLATLQKLGVVASFSRPHVSDDNPYSEALFRTLKYRPGYPTKPFSSIEAAHEWVEGFVGWYNEEHHHSGIQFVTPAERHAGKDGEILAKRKEVLEQARAKNPIRWTTNRVRNCEPIECVLLNPGKLPESGKAEKRFQILD